MNEVRNNLTEDDKLKINVKKNQSIWAIFNNTDDLDEVPGYIVEKNENDKFLAPIAEMDNLNINENNNQNNNQKTFTNNPSPTPVMNNMNNNNYYNNTNHNNNRNANYYNRHNNFQYPQYNPTGFKNNLVNKNMNYQPNNNMNNTNNHNMNNTNQQNYSHTSQNSKIDLKDYLMKSFNSVNEDFLILQPIFIPLIPGDDPDDNLEEHL